MKTYNYEILDTISMEWSFETVIVGTASEIRPIYKAFVRAFNAGCRTSLVPTFCNFPRFVEGKYYGISIGDDGYFQIINENTLVSMFLNGTLGSESEVCRP